jgi:hypothetical protein
VPSLEHPFFLKFGAEHLDRIALASGETGAR